MNIIEKGILLGIKHKVDTWFKLEKTLGSRTDTIHAAADSPEKSWPDPNKIPLGGEVPFSLANIPLVGASLKSCIHEGCNAIQSMKDNPETGLSNMSQEDLDSFAREANRKGIVRIGFAKLPQNLIFKERGVLFDNAIVLIKEMDSVAIEKAPSVETFRMVMSTYNELGILTNELTGILRTMGYQAHASHPLGGLVLYPPLAVQAGLGWMGRHGLLITPEFGPRQRISAIFVSAENLPFATTNEHQWIENFCNKCGKCIRSCPSGAILEKSLVQKSGRQTCIDRDKCLPLFVKNQGCTICIKACAFTKQSYETIHKNWR